MIDDPEILALLRNDPELLAIADAVQQTQQPLAARRRHFRRGRAGLALAACLALVAAVGAFVLRPSATAGIPDGEYVHVVLVRDDPATTLVSLRDGTGRPFVYKDELWIRADGGLLFAVRSANGKLVETSKDAASFGRSSRGPTKVNPDLRHGAGLDPLVASYGGTPAALRQGGHLVRGQSSMYRHRVVWIAFGSGALPRRIALDATTGTPVALQDSTRVPSRVVRYGLSRRPTFPTVQGTSPRTSHSTDGEPVSPAGAAAAVPGALWSGQAVAGLPLRSVLAQQLSQDGVEGSRPGVVLRYGQELAVPMPLTPYLYLSEARTPEAIYGFPGIDGVAPLPKPGFMQVTSSAPGARTMRLTVLVQIHGVYVRIDTNLRQPQLLRIVQRLRPVS